MFYIDRQFDEIINAIELFSRKFLLLGFVSGLFGPCEPTDEGAGESTLAGLVLPCCCGGAGIGGGGMTLSCMPNSL